MSVNPYESPRVDEPVVGVLSGSREDLRAVAKYQKGILICILIYLAAVVGQFALPIEVRLFLALGVIVVAITGAVFVFLLAIKVYGPGLGTLLGILSLVPFFGLFVLLIVNGKATKILRQNGVKVGFIGANLADV